MTGKPRPNSRLKRKINSWLKQPALTSLAFLIFIRIIVFGFDYLHFSASSDWIAISIALAGIMGFLCGVKLNNPPSMLVAFLCALGFFCVFAFGLGSALTSFSSVVEKDVTGVKRHTNGRYGSHYSVVSPDFIAGESDASIDITRDEYNSFPVGKIHVHVTLKESFFGTTVEQYTFVPAPTSQ